MTMAELFAALERVSGVPAPKRRLPAALLYAIAGASEVVARATGRPTLLSWAAIRSLMQEADRSRFDQPKSERELGLTFRRIEETLADETAWFRANGMGPQPSGSPRRPLGRCQAA